MRLLLLSPQVHGTGLIMVCRAEPGYLQSPCAPLFLPLCEAGALRISVRGGVCFCGKHTSALFLRPHSVCFSCCCWKGRENNPMLPPRPRRIWPKRVPSSRQTRTTSEPDRSSGCGAGTKGWCFCERMPTRDKIPVQTQRENSRQPAHSDLLSPFFLVPRAACSPSLPGPVNHCSGRAAVAVGCRKALERTQGPGSLSALTDSQT